MTASKMEGNPVPFFDNQSSDSNPDKLLTITQAAERLQVSVTTVRRLQQRRQIPFIKVGGSVRFDASDIDSYLSKHRVEPIDQ